MCMYSIGMTSPFVSVAKERRVFSSTARWFVSSANSIVSFYRQNIYSVGRRNFWCAYQPGTNFTIKNLNFRLDILDYKTGEKLSVSRR